MAAVLVVLYREHENELHTLGDEIMEFNFTKIYYDVPNCTKNIHLFKQILITTDIIISLKCVETCSRDYS